MEREEYTLEELARLLDLQPRTIRSYIQQELMRGPDSRGRNARYSDYHRQRLEEIKRLKDEDGLSLAEIRRQMTVAEPQEQVDALMDTQAAAPAEKAPEPSTALDYIRARRRLSEEARRPSTRQADVPHTPRRASPTGAGPVEKLLKNLRQLIRQRRVPRKARGEEWVRLQVTPDIEIHVRGQLAGEQLRGFEQLADLMRHILLGREEHE